MAFPDHMFEHWNGYNVIPPLTEPTPVGAVVPQFYGFYVPEDNEKASSAVGGSGKSENPGSDNGTDDDDSDDEDATLVVSRKPRTLSAFNIVNARMGMRPGGVSRLPSCKC